MQKGLAGMPEDGNPDHLSYRATNYDLWTKNHDAIYNIEFEEVGMPGLSILVAGSSMSLISWLQPH
jgi:hypothetical protein